MPHGPCQDCGQEQLERVELVGTRADGTITIWVEQWLECGCGSTRVDAHLSDVEQNRRLERIWGMSDPLPPWMRGLESAQTPDELEEALRRIGAQQPRPASSREIATVFAARWCEMADEDERMRAEHGEDST